jgi:hypothetical protein
VKKYDFNIIGGYFMNRKISFFCIFFAIVTIAYSQNDPYMEKLYSAVYNGDIDYIKKHFIDNSSPNDHYGFSNNDLRIL